MIGKDELRKKAARLWDDGRFLRCWLAGEVIFPWRIPLAPPSGKKISDHFAEVRDWIRALERGSKAATGTGYGVLYRPVNHRQLGPQKIPCQVCFETAADWLGYIGKQRDFKRFQEMIADTRHALPTLLPFLEQKPMAVLARSESWGSLLAVCRWFAAHPRPDRYIRQLDIPGVDTKFIEQNKKVLTDLLNRVLDPGGVDAAAVGLAGHGFERRFGLRYDRPSVRFRLLDSALAVAGLTDLTLPAADFAARDFGAATVFVTENKINGLAFPPAKGAMVVFGLGYGIEMLADVEWLRQKRVVYWGDIDTHGFAILSRLRGYFPRTRSLLMDRDTLQAHRRMWGREEERKRFLGECANLTEAEQALFCALKEDRFGPAVRLEQERIGFSWLVASIKDLI